MLACLATSAKRTGFVVPLVCFVLIALYGAVWQKLEAKDSEASIPSSRDSFSGQREKGLSPWNLLKRKHASGIQVAAVSKGCEYQAAIARNMTDMILRAKSGGLGRHRRGVYSCLMAGVLGVFLSHLVETAGAANTNLPPADYSIAAWSTEDGLPANDVTRLFQAS